MHIYIDIAKHCYDMRHYDKVDLYQNKKSMLSVILFF